MPLLTPQQIQTADRDELNDLICEINAHLQVVNTNDLLRAVKNLIEKHQMSNAAYITIGVDEWENGYFYSGPSRIRGFNKEEVELSYDVDCEFTDTLRSYLTELSYYHAVGRDSELYISLIDDTIRTDPSLQFLD